MAPSRRRAFPGLCLRRFDVEADVASSPAVQMLGRLPANTVEEACCRWAEHSDCIPSGMGKT